MEDLHIVDNWKDKMLGDLKEFSNKKHKPVGMHHLIKEIDKLANSKKLLDISFTSFKNDFKKETILENIEKKNNNLIQKLPIKISDLLKKDNLFTKDIKSVIIYSIPIPKSIFKYSINDIYNYFKVLKSEKKSIDNMILNALSKYGYWGITEEQEKTYLLSNFNKNKMFESAHLGEIAPNGLPITVQNGPRVFISYMISNAPLKVQIDKPINICNERCLNLTKKPSLNHIKYYKETFGIKKTTIDMVKSIIKDNKFGEYIDFCYNCKIGTEYEINLLVKDPLDYKK